MVRLEASDSRRAAARRTGAIGGDGSPVRISESLQALLKMVDYATTADGARIAYRSEGRGAPIVLLHGLSEDHRVAQRLAEDLRRDHRVVRLDFRGHGESSAAEFASLDTLVDDVRAVVQRLEVERPIVIGHSMGGAVAAAFAGLQSTAGVINVDQPMRFAALRAAVKSFEPGLRGPGFAEAMWAVACVLGAERLPEETARALRAYRESISPSLVLSIWEPLFESSIIALDGWSEDLMRGVRVPYLSIHGNDPGPGYAAWLRQLVPAAELEVWAGVGHWPHLSEPRRFIGRVREFVGTATRDC
jgi:pimeloyl-ACP methyl ester carboxylesterase